MMKQKSWYNFREHIFFFQAPQRLVRDKNLSVVSSPSILESVQQKSSGDVNSSSLPPSPPLQAEEKGNVTAASSSDTPLCGGNDRTQEATLTGHITPSIHMTLEDHQRQLQTLQDEVIRDIIPRARV